MKKYIIALIVCFLGINFLAFAQSDESKSGFEIKAKVQGVAPGQDMKMAVFKGKNSFVLDTQKVAQDGFVTFKGTKRLGGGLYYIVLPTQKYFQIIVDHDQYFSVETSTEDLTKLTFTGSPDNEEYQAYVKKTNELAKNWQELKPKRDAFEKDSKDWEKINEEMKALNEISKQNKTDFIKNNPKGVYSILMQANDPVIPPEAPEEIEGEEAKNLWRFFHYKRHFWDNFDFTDGKIVRAGQIYHDKLEEYITKRTYQQTDSIIKYANIITDKVKAYPDVFEYTVNYIANYYYEPKVMCLEAVFVHMVDKYMSGNQPFWLGEAELFRVRDRAAGMRPSLCGKPGQNIGAFDKDGKMHNLMDLKKPLVLLFMYSGGCEHCQKAAPEVIDLYNKYHPQGILDVYSLCTDVESADFIKFSNRFQLPWKDNVLDTAQRSRFYKKYHIGKSLPELYLLDENRNIIAKKLTPEQMDEEIQKWMEARNEEEEDDGSGE